MKYSKIKFLTFFAIICSIGLTPINDASAAENTVTATITVGDTPRGIAFDSVNNRMYVANRSDDTVSVINTATNTVTATITVGDGPSGIEFDSANNRMYVANYNAGTVSVINTATNTVTATITVGSGPNGIAFDSVNNRMYVANIGADTVSVIDTATNTVIDANGVAAGTAIDVGNGPWGIAFDSVNNRMYVTNRSDDTVSVINTATNTVTATITVGTGSRGIAFDSVNNRMYVTNYNAGTVSVIDTSDNTVTGPITVGDGPYGIEFDSANNRMYVANYNAGTVSVINTATNTVTATITVGNLPLGIAFDSANNRMYVSNNGDDNVSVIDIAPFVATPTTTTTSSDCYDCKPPVLQSSHIIILTNDYIVTTGDSPIHITANVGDKVTIFLNVTDNKSVQTIPFAALYTNYQEKPSDMSAFYANNFDKWKHTSTSFYEWNIRSDDVPYDYDGTLSWSENFPTVVTGEITDDNYFMINDNNVLQYFMMPFTFTINDFMEESTISAKIYDAAGNRLHVTLPVTLQTAGNDPLNFDNLGKQKVLGFYDESVLSEMVQTWSESEYDAKQLSSLLGISDESLPAWSANLATWVAEGTIDSADLIVAVEYLINQ
jgi:YVTN family beta-propeller protein